MNTESNCINVFSTVTSYTNKCRFCYSYTPPGPVENCCVPKVCTTNEFLQNISSLTMVVNNNTRTSERSLLLSKQQQFFQENAYQQTSTIVQSTIANSDNITSTIVGQLYQIKDVRYQPYQPYIYPCVPQQVIDFQMATVNVGVPESFFTVADCKANQSVTEVVNDNYIAPVVSGQVKLATYFSLQSQYNITVSDMTTDSDDNVYIIGMFQGTITIFNYDSPPISGAEVITSIYGTISGVNQTVYIIKYNSSGDVQWATTLTAKFYNYGYSITSDNSNNIYVTGFFPDTTPLTINNYSSPPIDGGPVGLSVYGKIANPGVDCGYIIKYNSSGVAQWATNIRGINNQLTYSLATDLFGNIYVSGTSASNPVVINNYNSPPVSGGFVGLSLYGNLPNTTNQCVFIIKYNSLGKAQWATNIEGTFDIYAEGGYISIDQIGNVYLAGSYTTNPITIKSFNNYVSPNINTITYGTLANISNFDIFVVKYNSSGIAQWATNIGGVSKDVLLEITSDIFGNCSITGYYESTSILINSWNNTTIGTINVIPYGTLPNISTFRNTFVVSYDTTGKVKWATNVLSDIDSTGTTITTDQSGNVYVAGNYYGKKLSLYNFDSGPTIPGNAINLDLYGIVNCSSPNGNMFLIKYNQLGQIQWMTVCPTDTGASNPSISATLSGYIYVSGRFGTTILINNYSQPPSTNNGIVGLNPYGFMSLVGYNGYLLKITQ